MAKIYVGDIGTTITLDTGQSLTGATSLKIKYKKPNGVTGSWTGTGATTKISYISLANDLDVSGNWILQAYVEFTSWKGHGDVVELHVYDLFS